jgi:hypothetical protein
VFEMFVLLGLDSVMRITLFLYLFLFFFTYSFFFDGHVVVNSHISGFPFFEKTLSYLLFM